jgi:hypothetical protein
LLPFTASLATVDQSISLEWSISESYLEGFNGKFFYDPETASNYSVGLNEEWSLGRSIWQSKASEPLYIGMIFFAFESASNLRLLKSLLFVCELLG